MKILFNFITGAQVGIEFPALQGFAGIYAIVSLVIIKITFVNEEMFGAFFEDTKQDE